MIIVHLWASDTSPRSKHGNNATDGYRHRGLTHCPRYLGHRRLDVGGTDEEESIRTIHAALDLGINVLDTAPVYGFGRSEEIVGKAIALRGGRNRIIIATKVGIECREGEVFRNSTPARLDSRPGVRHRSLGGAPYGASGSDR